MQKFGDFMESAESRTVGTEKEATIFISLHKK